MRVVLISKALVVGAYQRKAEEIARCGVDLTVVIPPAWSDRRGHQPAEARFTEGYTVQILPIHFNGNYHLHFYPGLGPLLRHLRPDVVHMDEEPYNLATWLGIRAAQAAGAKPTFFTWQNLHRRYPPPFRWMEQANYRACALVMAGNAEATTVLRQKGYGGEVRIIPQVGVDPEIFAPDTQHASRSTNSFHIGYAGGLLPEKGLDLLLRACAGLHGTWHLSLVGSGESEAELRRLAETLGIAHNVTLGQRIPSHEMANFYRGLDVLVLPSRSQPNWKEQFGRVLIEAMASAVPVIGSSCGEIPNVIGDAGLIFPEGDSAALQAHLQALLDDPTARDDWGQKGRQRVWKDIPCTKLPVIQWPPMKLYVYADCD